MGRSTAVTEQLQKAIAEYRGNWTKFTDFVWFEQPADAQNWAIFEMCTRDSSLLSRHNTAQVLRQMHKFLDVEDDPDALDWSASHWAVGYTKGIAVRVCDDAGKPTKAFRVLHRLLHYIENYEVLAPAVYDKALRREVLSNLDFLLAHGLPESVSCSEQPLSKDRKRRLLNELSRVDAAWDDDLNAEGVPYPKVETLVAALRNLGLVEEEEEEAASL